MPPYVRPPIPPEQFRDDAGEVIPYGQRWGSGGPPEDTYSVVTHPERYTALHTVAHALIAHLRENYAVVAHEGPEPIAEFTHPENITAAVQLVPRRSDEAPIVIALTNFPGVRVHAGLLHEFVFPSCGCVACDEDVLGQIEELENTILSIINGGYTERVVGETQPVASFRLEGEWGSRDGSIIDPGQQDERVREVRGSIPETWRPWTPLPAT